MSDRAAEYTMSQIRRVAADRIADERSEIAAWGVPD
jgi:hypothetical protein